MLAVYAKNHGVYLPPRTLSDEAYRQKTCLEATSALTVSVKTKPLQMFLRRGTTSWSRPFRLHAFPPQRPLILPNIRYFTSTPWKLVMPSPESQISRMLKESNHDKWGFVIYRCTYKNDQDWARFKQLVHDRTKQLIAESDTPEIADSLEWTFVEERATLDGASRPQLRERFNTWAEKAYAIEQPRHSQLDFQNWGLWGLQRYNYFIQVDEEALQSVLSPPEFDWHEQGFVNFVDSRWRPMSDEDYYRGMTNEQREEVLDAIDGCEQENVGWMRITPMLMVSAEWYGTVGDFGVTWYAVYLRPPEVVVW